MSFGLKILFSLNLAVCLSSCPLAAMEDGKNLRNSFKRLYPAPLSADPSPLEAPAPPKLPLEQNYVAPLPPHQAHSIAGLEHLNSDVSRYAHPRDKHREAEKEFNLSGNPQSLNNLGYMCLRGIARLDLSTQVERDLEAVRYFKASQIPKANYNLALMYMQKRAEPQLGPKARFKIVKALLENSEAPKAKTILKWYQKEYEKEVESQRKCVIL